MAWLIRRRALAVGLQTDYKRKIEGMLKRIDELSADIEALDLVIRIHPTKVDPSTIDGKAPRKARLGAYGQILRAIYTCLRLNKGTPVYTTEVAMFVAKDLGYKITRKSKPIIVGKMRVRLCQLCARGKILAHHDSVRDPTAEGQWSLLLEDLEGVSQAG
jgi:hypothetical protein